MNKHIRKPRNPELYRAILAMESVEELMSFFDDLCTVSELQAMEQRYQVASLLEQGFVYNHILEQTGASSATISRVNRCLQYGAGGYNKAFERLRKQDTPDEKTDGEEK
ncbi:MAG: YerC/YecD family TrpR-related protein [Eubacteriales bacterium]|nr:YerC/YecD family TrpR-related protein [Eubacteriales bacterium]